MSVAQNIYLDAGIGSSVRQRIAIFFATKKENQKLNARMAFCHAVIVLALARGDLNFLVGILPCGKTEYPPILFQRSPVYAGTRVFL